MPAGLMLALCLSSYFLGRAHANVKIIREKGEEIIKKVEVIKYVEHKSKEIYATPNIGRDYALELFKRGVL